MRSPGNKMMTLPRQANQKIKFASPNPRCFALLFERALDMKILVLIKIMCVCQICHIQRKDVEVLVAICSLVFEEKVCTELLAEFLSPALPVLIINTDNICALTSHRLYLKVGLVLHPRANIFWYYSLRQSQVSKNLIIILGVTLYYRSCITVYEQASHIIYAISAHKQRLILMKIVVSYK